MAKKSAIERYNWMDETSSKEDWNHDFGTMIIDVLRELLETGKPTRR
jgi:hypothetical protein